MKNIRPLYSTVVDPSEYDIDTQMTDWLKAANQDKAFSYDIDVGKLWGLYQSWKEMKEELAWAWENMTYNIPPAADGAEYDFCSVCHEPEYEHNPDCEALKHKEAVEEMLGRKFYK